MKKILFTFFIIFSFGCLGEESISKMMRVRASCDNLKLGLYQNINPNVQNRNLWFAGTQLGFLQAAAEKLQDEDKFCKPRGVDNMSLVNLVYNRLEDEQYYGDIKKCSAMDFIEKVLTETYPCHR